MCGICGLVSYPSSLPLELDNVLESLRPRGPDAQGIWKDPAGRAVLGHTRLSIIDLGGSAQPMRNEDGTVMVTYNGEIYNYRSLRKNLSERGHQFRTEGDTEVLVHFFEECGPQMVEHLDGIFAFGLYDTKRNYLLLARDRVGVKPLYYWIDPQSKGILFASDLQALITYRRVPRQLNKRGLSQYLHFGFVIPPDTWLQEVRQLPPGHILQWNNGDVRVTPYYKWEYRPDKQLADNEKAIQTLHQILTEVVEEQLVADVPIGSFLSGGIDSSVIAGIAQENRAKLDSSINTYTVRFWTAKHDESPRARSIASDLRTNHIEVNAQEIQFERNFIDRLVAGLGEPLADTSALAVYFLSQQVRKHVKVALSGDGGDELFFGYKGILKQRLATRLRFAPEWARRTGIALTSTNRSNLERRLNKYLRLSLNDNPGLIIDWARRWEWKELFQLLPSDLFVELFPWKEAPFPEIRDMIGHGSSGGFAEQQLQYHMLVDLPCDNLVKVDRMSMAHGLEVRVPMLGNKMLDFGQKLPMSVRAFAKRTKEPLRTLGEKLAPTLTQPAPKHGFSFPLESWICGKLSSHWREWNLTSVLRRLGFNGEELDRMVDHHHELGTQKQGFQSSAMSAKLFDLLLVAVWADNNQIQSC